MGISKYNRTEKKNHNEKFKTNKKLIYLKMKRNAQKYQIIN